MVDEKDLCIIKTITKIPFTREKSIILNSNYFFNFPAPGFLILNLFFKI